MSAARRAAAWLFYLLGAARIARWLNRRKLVVVCYHGVTLRDDGAAGDEAGLQVDAEAFGRQLRYLRSRYHVISLDEYRRALLDTEIPMPRNPLLITFDDGKRNCLTAALPLLESERLPAAFFVITGFLEDDPQDSLEWTAADDSSYLTWDDAIRLASRPEYEIGSHTASHQWLPACSNDRLTAEIEVAADEIRSRLGKADPALTYPWGARDERVLSAAGRTHDVAFTIDGGSNMRGVKPLEQARVPVGNRESRATFALRIAGVTRARPPGGPPARSQ